MLAVLYAISIAVLTVYGGNLLWLAIRYARRDTLRRGTVPPPDALPAAPNEWPDVTLQLPLYNEPLVAERLIDACARLRYPQGKLEIQVLDDSTDSTSDRTAKRVEYWRRKGADIIHIRRSHREGYKAGALQNGLRFARGEFVAIFDADFLPEADFLLQTIPRFTSPQVGLVQARWGHLNQDVSMLTRIQAVGLDAHFAVEQHIREQEGCFINFNGTAGVWRRSCIEDAGGWHGDTIAEDLDLSYRAQMKGWGFRYLEDLEVPAELPSSLSALRSQQFRWAKGSVETARKLLIPLVRSNASARAKAEGVLHLTGHLVFPFVLLAALIHPPLLIRAASGLGPGNVYFGWMAIGLIGFAGFALVQLLAQRELYPDWGDRMRLFPLFMAGTIGLSLNNSRAVMEALVGKPTAFVRTPKINQRSDGQAPVPGDRPSFAIPAIAWFELALFVYSLAGVGALAAVGQWAAIPFQAVFATGFGIMIAETLRDRRRTAVMRPA